MRVAKKVLLVGMAAAMPVALVTVIGASAASAKTQKYDGPALGKVTCTGVVGKVKLSPPLKNSSGGTSAKFTVKLSACTVSGLPAGTTETITGAKASGTASEPGTGCDGLASGNTNTIPLTVKWKGTYDGTKAKFAESTVDLNGFVAAFNSSDDAGFEIPNPSTQPRGGSVTGSFAGTVTNESTVYSDTNINTLGAECGAKGVKKLALTSGTVNIP